MSGSDETIEIIQKESDEFFLYLIRSRPCLYDKRLPEHHDKIVLENAMEEIAFILNDTVENCEKKWKHFQAAYQREKMLEERETRSGAGVSQRQKWPYYEKMKSLYSSNTYRQSFTNLKRGIPNKNVSEVSPNCRTIKKKKKDTELVLSAYNNVQSQLQSVINLKQNNCCKTFQDQAKEVEENNCNALVGKLIAAKLNECSPIKAKKKRKLIMKCLIENDSDESS